MEVITHWKEMRTYNFPERIEKLIIKLYGAVNSETVQRYIFEHNVERYVVKKETDDFEVVDIN